MKLGSDTLKQYIEEKDLSVDRIDDVFTYIEDTLMDFDEIESTIKQNQSVINNNDDEFEEEFNELLKEETQKNKKPDTVEVKTEENNTITPEDSKVSNMSLDSDTSEKISTKLSSLAI